MVGHEYGIVGEGERHGILTYHYLSDFALAVYRQRHKLAGGVYRGHRAVAEGEWQQAVPVVRRAVLYRQAAYGVETEHRFTLVVAYHYVTSLPRGGYTVVNQVTAAVQIVKHRSEIAFSVYPVKVEHTVAVRYIVVRDKGAHAVDGVARHSGLRQRCHDSAIGADKTGSVVEVIVESYKFGIGVMRR